MRRGTWRRSDHPGAPASIKLSRLPFFARRGMSEHVTNLYTSFHLTQSPATSYTHRRHFDHPKNCSWDHPGTNAAPIRSCWSSDRSVCVSEVRSEEHTSELQSRTL